MRRLLNTLYITSEESYLALDGENVIVKKGEDVAASAPIGVTAQSATDDIKYKPTPSAKYRRTNAISKRIKRRVK